MTIVRGLGMSFLDILDIFETEEGLEQSIRRVDDRVSDPPSGRDIDYLVNLDIQVNMDSPMADPCPWCGGFNMKAGDYVCWGICYRCVVHGLELEARN